MDYEKKYKDVIEKTKQLLEANPSDEGIKNWVEDTFPELKESEDEKLRKALIRLVNDTENDELCCQYGAPKKDILAWLEKQEGQKTVNGSELKFETKGCPVDLGLPSGTLWCDRNVYATSPTDHGAFFSWGNVLPHFPNMCLGDWGKEEEAFAYDFNVDAYRETNGAELRGDIDLPYDAAHINMGEPWRMPSAEQFQELVDNCVWSRVTIKGVHGYNVVSKINGRSIFFPCSGHGYERSWYCRNISGSYWSRSFNSTHSTRYLLFNTNGVNPQYNSIRYYGFPIRAIQYSKDK